MPCYPCKEQTGEERPATHISVGGSAPDTSRWEHVCAEHAAQTGWYDLGAKAYPLAPEAKRVV